MRYTQEGEVCAGVLKMFASVPCFHIKGAKIIEHICFPVKHTYSSMVRFELNICGNYMCKCRWRNIYHNVISNL